jgi:CubicO group peptidase (beta-lactamase class C family)
MIRTVSFLLIACMFPTVGLGQTKAGPKSVASQQTTKLSGADPVKDPQWLRERLEKVRRRYDLPDLGAAIVVGDKVVAASAVGVRKYGTNIPVTQDDPFHLGSITKVMTATLIGMMVEDGVLRWNTTMEKMFPDLVRSMQPAYRNVTVLQLLSHTGGFPYSPSMPMDKITALGKNGAERRYAYVKAAIADPPQAAPGTKVIYSGGPVVVIAYIERKMKKTYEQLMQERVFWPLGMTTAGFGDHMASEGEVDAPWGHRETNRKTTPIEPDHHSPVNGREPVGGAFCSMIDFGKFLAFHLQGSRGRGELLKPGTFRVLHTAAPGGNFAPGWSIEYPDWAEPEKGLVLSHTGSIGTHVAMCWVVPWENYALCVGTNAGGDPKQADEALGDIFRYLLARIHHGDAAAEKLGASSQPPPPLPTPDVWLNSLTPVVATVGWGKFSVNQTDVPTPLVLDGDVYAHGLGLHAPTEVAYELNPSYQRFVARVGAEERVSWRASVVARVYLDETLAVESPLLRAGDAPWNVDVTIPGRLRSGTAPRRLRLVITDGGNGLNSDCCDWVSAGFITRKNR